MKIKKQDRFTMAYNEKQYLCELVNTITKIRSNTAVWLGQPASFLPDCLRTLLHIPSNFFQRQSMCCLKDDTTASPAATNTTAT